MLGFTIKKTQEIEAAKTALINAQAKAQATEKKFKTAVITGSATTGTAAAAIAAHFLFGNGRKVQRNKIKNFDSVVEERDNAITAKVTADAKISTLETEKKGLESTCELLAGSAYNVQVAAVAATGGEIEKNSTFQRACYDHDLLVKKTFNTKNDEEFMKLRKNLFKSFTDSIKELEKLDTDEAETEEATEEQTEEQTEEADKALKEAQAKYDAAYKKAGAAKTVLENAEKKLAAAKKSAPDGDHKDLEAAVNTAKAAFDAADKELEDADKALKALQNNG